MRNIFGRYWNFEWHPQVGFKWENGRFSVCHRFRSNTGQRRSCYRKWSSKKEADIQGCCLHSWFVPTISKWTEQFKTKTWWRSIFWFNEYGGCGNDEQRQEFFGIIVFLLSSKASLIIRPLSRVLASCDWNDDIPKWQYRTCTCAYNNLFWKLLVFLFKQLHASCVISGIWKLNRVVNR